MGGVPSGSLGFARRWIDRTPSGTDPLVLVGETFRFYPDVHLISSDREATGTKKAQHEGWAGST